MIRSQLAFKLFGGGAVALLTYALGHSYDFVATEDAQLAALQTRNTLTKFGGTTIRSAPNGTQVVRLRGYQYAWANLSAEGRELRLTRVGPPREVNFRTVRGAAQDDRRVLELVANRSELKGLVADAGLPLFKAIAEPERLGGVRVLVDGEQQLLGYAMSKPQLGGTLDGENIASWSVSADRPEGIASFVTGMDSARWLSLSVVSDLGTYSLKPNNDMASATYREVKSSLSTEKAAAMEEVSAASRAPPEAVYKCVDKKTLGEHSDWPAINVLTAFTPAAARRFLSTRDIGDELKIQQDFVTTALATSGLKYRAVFQKPVPIDLEAYGVATDEELVTQLVEAKSDFDLMGRNPGAAKKHAMRRVAYRSLDAERRAHSADLAIVFVSALVGQQTDPALRTNAGWASRIPADGARFFALVGASVDEIRSGKTVAHETAHLLGGRHNLEFGAESAPPANHGLRFLLPLDSPQIERGTLTAVDASRLPIFSSPKQICEGVRLGIARAADEVQVLSQTLPRLVNLHNESGEPESLNADAQICKGVMSDATLRGETCPSTNGTCKFALSHFGTGEAQLSADMQKELGKFANTLLRAELQKMAYGPGEPSVVVAGYTDGSGADDYNVALSFRRAKAVYDLLQRELGPDNGIPVFSCAYGKSRPLAGDPTASDPKAIDQGARNRRVELHVLSIPDSS